MKSDEPEVVKFPFGKWKGRTIAEIPSKYLDWLLGKDWFWKKNIGLAASVVKELEMRKRSHYEPPEGREEEETKW